MISASKFKYAWDTRLNAEHREDILKTVDRTLSGDKYIDSIYSEACKIANIKVESQVSECDREMSIWQRIMVMKYSQKNLEGAWEFLSEEEKKEIRDSIEYDGRRSFDDFGTQAWKKVKILAFEKGKCNG